MVSKDTEIVENTEKLSHGDTETQSKPVLSVSVSLWLQDPSILEMTGKEAT